MNYKVLIAAFLAASVAGVASGGIQEPPLRWSPYGDANEASSPCTMGVDSDLRTAGQLNLTISCSEDNASVVGLRQGFLATPFWGKQIRFSAWIKTAGVEGAPAGAGAGIYVVHSTNVGDEFHQMNAAALTGWTDWEYREVVIDVPAEGQWLNIGLWLQGHGQAWLRDPEFEVIADAENANAGGQEQ